ncbi:transcriptional regulator with XRE-family HTH domain [Actinoalloteichus hoggarensis]|nr:helix-turn-helix transcriptional regulator [Actinoalloteichus hoggarensis]MBB5921688.1 transcriptional regulator with XRE-family HTH domain [Actinoalloteichus hoggarensis]
MVGTPKAVAIGRELRRARENTGLSARALSLKMGLAAATVGRWESGTRTPRPVDVSAVLAVLGVDESEREELVEMARDAGGRRWVATGLPEQARALTALLESERDAVEIVSMSPLLIPGLLQTSDYARSIIGAGGVPDNEVEMRVRVRLGRREILTRQDRPTELLAIIGEGALRRLVGGPTVLSEQLHALRRDAALPNVHIHVVPFTAGWSPDLEGLFDVLIFNDARDPIVHTENRRSSLFFHEPEDVEAYRTAVDIVMDAALSPEQSTGLITKIINGMESP